ncbi:MAG: isoleucine--tRNA ligase [Candidatus Methanomethylicaceae archaeon]|jgi:isoleucyl-tRNA synthetase
MAFVGSMPKDYRSGPVEEEVFRYWESSKIPEKLRARKVGKKFYFLDGPPYVTNPIHVGTAWNKTLKDAYIRYLRMNGYIVRDQPGFDMHGLPIEVMVEKKIGIKSKKDIEVMGIEKFISVCKSFAIENLKVATTQFKNLGVWMDWEAPYRTLDNDYIESVWWLISRAEEKKLLGKGKKIVHWCPRCETVLAGYEATDEYRDVEEESIYVKFQLEGKEKEYIIIWTTTPWTLPANVAVMVHPDFRYARVRSGDEIYTVAEERLEQVFKEVGKDYEVLETMTGTDLQGLVYVAPLLEEVPFQAQLKPAHMVVLSDQFVTLEEGTGCVHCAPGHGEEDHAVGEIYGLPDFCPVDERGRFTTEGGKYAGENVRDANRVIIGDLKRKGLLFKVELTKHRYPHCWRCKTPLILRIASQWFIKVTDLKETLLEENEKVTWVPDWAGKSRFGNWIKNAKDWVISRQRYWGIPLPIWVCEKCGNYEVFGSRKDLKRRAAGSYQAAESNPDFQLHRPWVDGIEMKCGCGGTMRRVPDVADVWMDSGSASFATLHYPADKKGYEYWWPVDMILEGHDQTRGWFYTLMVCGVTAFGTTPYRRVLMHGFTIDQDGRAMHKSLGNVVFPEEVIEKFGRDTLRWYELGCTTWEDLRFSWKAVEETSRFINIMWSTYYFASLYMNLDRFSMERHPLETLRGVLRAEDRWVLSRFERLVEEATASMDGLKIFEAVRSMEDFMKEELSRWYVRLIRKRTWSEEEDPDKIAAYATLSHVLLNYLKMAAPVIPFASEKIYQDMFSGMPGMPESVHMLGWPKQEGAWKDESLETDMEIAKEVIEASYSARQSARVKIRQPLMRLKVVSDEERVREAMKRLRGIVLEQTNVKEVEVITPREEEEMKGVVLSPNRAALGPIFRARSGRVAELIAGLDGKATLDALSRGEPVLLDLDGEKIELKKDYVTVQEKLPENYKGVKSRFGVVYIDTTKSKDLIAEGLMRDIVRRVQEMRKKANLRVDAYIKVIIFTPNEENRELLLGKAMEISMEVRAKEFAVTAKEAMKAKFVEEWEIEEDKFTIGIDELQPS